MERSRNVLWAAGMAVLFGLLTLAGCMLFQPKVEIDFEATPVSGRAPLLVDFTPIVEENVAAYEWDFGDGVTSNEAAPSRIYRTAGTFTVSLRVRFIDGDAAETVKADLIEVEPKLHQAAPVGQLYWLDRTTGTIGTGDREGNESRTVVSGVYNGRYLAVGGGKIYWTTLWEVKRAGLDGTGVETLYDYVWGYTLQGIAADPTGGRIYWVALHEEGDWRAKIYTANLDGSGARVWASREKWTIVTSYVPWLLAIDSANGRLYWFERFSDFEPGAIPVSLPQPMTYDDCSVHWTPLVSFEDHTLFGNLPDSRGLALDIGLPVGARYAYWTNPEADRVTRCKADGTAYSWMLNNIDDPVALAIDAAEGRIYWSGSKGIHRANLDGSEQELIYPGVSADALALDI